MKLTILCLILTVIGVVNAKKWQTDKDIQHEGQHDHHRGHDGDKHDERRREKEQYYRNKQFSGVDYKKIQKHSPIAVSEDDAKLQADLDVDDRKLHNKKVSDELHRQHLIGADEGKWRDEEKEKEKHHSRMAHRGNNRKHEHKDKDVTKPKDKPMSIPDVESAKERQHGYGKHGKNKKEKRQHEKQRKQKKRYGYNKRTNGKRYKMTVYEHSKY